MQREDFGCGVDDQAEMNEVDDWRFCACHPIGVNSAAAKLTEWEWVADTPGQEMSGCM